VFTKAWKFITEIFGETEMVTLKKTATGRYGLFDREGFLINDYARARDARRGATRAGMVIA
jgi:hypothetical protein